MAFTLSISPDLIEQLQEESGIVRKPQAPSSSSRLPSFPLPGYSGFDPATAALVSHSRELQQTLTRSQRIGGLLLKHEHEELAKVEAMANQLLGSPAAAPARALRCSAEREECVKCYKDHAGDELQCRSSVAAYEECARRITLEE